MKTLICPISPLRINRNVARITGFFMAVMLALYAYTGTVYFVIAIVIDYFIRAFTPLTYSPFSWLAHNIVDVFNWPPDYQDKAPKIFAARVGFLFALTAALLYPGFMTASLIVGTTLMVFALLESVFDFCVGCIVYTYIVLPFAGPQTKTPIKPAAASK